MTFVPKNILVPVATEKRDDLALAKVAIDAACDLAKPFGAAITLLHLEPAINPGSSAAIDVSGKIYHSVSLVLKSRMARGRSKLEALKDYAEELGADVNIKVVDSFENTAEAICEMANRLDSDLIVIASHTFKGIKRFFMGSVAEKVVHLSKVPVLFFHYGDKD